MNKEEYKKRLQRHYPDEPEEVLELAWYFHGVEKAKKYIEILMGCNNYADVATKAVRMMYVSCDIDSVTATKEAFVTALLPFTCMSKTWNAHSATYHIRNMLRDNNVKAERKAGEARQSQTLLAMQSSETIPAADVTIQIQFRTDDAELIRQIMLLASQCNAVFAKVEERYFDASIYRNDPYGLYRLECGIKDMPITIINMRSLFDGAEPMVRYISRYIDENDMPLEQALQLAENEPNDDF